MDVQLIVVLLVVGAAGYGVFRQVRRQLGCSAKGDCQGCPWNCDR